MIFSHLFASANGDGWAASPRHATASSAEGARAGTDVGVIPSTGEDGGVSVDSTDHDSTGGGGVVAPHVHPGSPTFVEDTGVAVGAVGVSLAGDGIGGSAVSSGGEGKMVGLRGSRGGSVGSVGSVGNCDTALPSGECGVNGTLGSTVSIVSPSSKGNDDTIDTPGMNQAVPSIVGVDGGNTTDHGHGETLLSLSVAAEGDPGTSSAKGPSLNEDVKGSVKDGYEDDDDDDEDDDDDDNDGKDGVGCNMGLREPKF